MLLIYPNNFTNRLYYYFDILLFDVFSIFSAILYFFKKVILLYHKNKIHCYERKVRHSGVFFLHKIIQIITNKC